MTFAVGTPTERDGAAPIKSFDASVAIAASPERVWTILVDGAAYPEWDSGVVRIEGQIALNEKIKVFSKLSPERAFPVKVTELTPNRKLAWTGGMPLGLFQGVRTFVLTPESDGTRFTMHEDFTGPLLPLIWRKTPDLEPVFQQFAQDLKARAEQPAH